MYQILTLSALSSVAGHQDKGLGHDFAQSLAHLRVGCPYYSAHVAVGTAHALLSPAVHHLSHDLVERSAVHQPILELPAGGIGRLDQNEQPLMLLFAHIHKGLDAVGSQIGIYRGEILVEWRIGAASHRDPAQMGGGVGRGSGTDVPSLHIADHDQILLVTIVHRLLESDHPRDAELLVHGDLGLDRGNQIVNRIHNSLVVLPHRLGGSLQRLAEFLVCFLYDVLRYIGEHRIQSHHNGGSRLSDFFTKLVNHWFSSCMSLFRRRW